jgi:predicted membrane metal-binding protein
MYVGGYTYADVGDVVEFYAKITDVGLKYDGRYSWSNVASGVKYFCTVSREDLAITANDRTLFEDFNVFIRDTLRSGMDDDSFAVAYAMLCGNSDYTDTDVFDGYRSAGVAHIFAVSGLHIGFLSSALYIIFKKVRINEYVKTLLIITVLFAYSGVCGFSSSSLRATVMFGVLSFARVSGKRYDMLSSISLAFIILALFS